ncbi:hypothetical protein INT48_005995 [Thamnidium elegans]|uniref:Ion transport domain-containing protein n=1 Tax=Thamnidium elegans TaxID=101142 RepID=A0A8H7STG3_9FUNG|nr:hypothetical protein INT48_005995 [Thamnidium elegans]
MRARDSFRSGDAEHWPNRDSFEEAEEGGFRSEEYSALYLNTTQDNVPLTRSPYRYRQNQAWVSLSALVDERRSDGRLMTNLDEDEPHTPFEATSAQDINDSLKRKLYLLMENPSSSNAAFWVNVVVSVLIVFSAIMITVETIPAFRSAESNKVWFNMEIVMVAIFSLEYILRMFAHSDSFSMLGKFFISPLTIIDFISIVPFYIEIIAKRDTTYEFRYLILRLFRLFRLFKTYKYTNTLVMTIEVMVIAFRRSRDAFSFDSIPATFWFVIVTITTTGYGDIVPATFIGKLVTFPAMVFGVLLIALPSIIMGRHFTIVWEAMRRRQHYNSSAVGGKKKKKKKSIKIFGLF